MASKQRNKLTVPDASVFNVGILRTVRGSLKRFVALAIIAALGVTVFVGLMIACEDLRVSADKFFDSQQLYDIVVQSTLGLTDDDVDALAELDGVDVAEGGWSETVYTTVGTGSEKVDVKALTATGLNEPQVIEGHLPTRDDQVAVTKRFLEESGLSLGDTVTFHGDGDGDEDATIVFERKEYTIVGVVLDPMDINAGQGSMSFRSSGSSQYSFFVLASNVCEDYEDVYTAIYITVEGASDLLCYSDEYEELVAGVLDQIEDEIKEDREGARYEEVLAAAQAQIDDAEAEALEKLDDAQAELDDAQAQIDDGYAELEEGISELEDQEASAIAQLDEAQATIDASYAQLDAAQESVDAGLAQLAAGLGCSTDGIADALDENHDTLVAGRAAIETSATMMATLMGDEWPTDAWNALVSATTVADAEAAAAEVDAALVPYAEDATDALDALIEFVDSDSFRDAWEEAGEAYDGLSDEVKDELRELLAELPDGVESMVDGLFSLTPDGMVSTLTSVRSMISQVSELASGMVQIVEGEVQLAEAEAAYEQLVAAQAEIDAGREELDSGATELSEQRASALAQIAEGWETIEESESTLADSQAELDDAAATLAEEREDALAQIEDARSALDDIDTATWYVQDRTSLSSYSSVDSDASSIEVIGEVVPVVFLLIAILISLTTMTRMVEEERGLVGLYKALGYSRGRILSKYALYALAGCLAGGLIGNFLGFVVLPAILFTIFSTMYALPEFVYCFNAAYAFGSVALFAVAIVGATIWACLRSLKEPAAALMRPKAPKAGTRILLERIGPLWRHLSFLNKVTARNLFRYRRRLAMTVFGVAGCVALLITGFGIKDTVVSLSDRQYGSVVDYDLMAVTSTDDHDEVMADLEADDEVADLTELRIDSLTVEYDGQKESVTLYVVPDGTSLEGYVGLEDTSGNAIEVPETGCLITVNAQQVLGFSLGDELAVQDSVLNAATLEVEGICVSYLGNSIYMSQSAYEAAFGGELEVNGVLAHLTGNADEQVAFGEELSLDGRILSVTCTQKLVNTFSSSFTLINTVVYVIIVLAAALAFAVVFTLSNTNISERERELATIKVLGFRRAEVHTYINKETLILTGIGALVGIPVGYALCSSLTFILKMPSLYFDVVIAPVTYVYSVGLALLFTVLINQITNRTLDRIDMVGALKSAE